MKLCIPAEAGALDAAVDPRLGRVACFVLVDGDTGAILGAVENHQNRQSVSGAGIQAGQTIANAGAEALLCANIGPKAFRVLKAAGIRVYLGAAGTVAETVAAFKEGRLTEAAEANVEGHWA